jgi:hypothetical protein
MLHKRFAGNLDSDRQLYEYKFWVQYTSTARRQWPRSCAAKQHNELASLQVTELHAAAPGQEVPGFQTGLCRARGLARNKRIERAAQVNLRCVPGRILALMLHQIPVENRFRTAWVKTRSRLLRAYVGSGQLQT